MAGLEPARVRANTTAAGAAAPEDQIDTRVISSRGIPVGICSRKCPLQAVSDSGGCADQQLPNFSTAHRIFVRCDES